MATENFYERVGVPTDPLDPNDPPKFGQLIETAKDAFVSELTSYFDYQTSDATSKLTELPTVQKFALGAGTGEQTLREVVKIAMAYADTSDRFPMIAITSSSLRERRLGIGSGLVGHVQYPPSIVSTKTGPFNLTDGWELKITTWPNGFVTSATESTITMASILFVDPTSVTVAELASAINRSQALYYQCEETTEGYLRISTGGPCAITSPNYIEVTGGDTACLSALGFTLGQSDTWLSTANPTKNRYGFASDMTVNIDVITDDINTRQELCDLVYAFFAFWMEKRRFEFYGRSYADRSITPEEWWHIVLQSQFTWSGELSTLRQGGGEAYDYIYANRGAVSIFIADYLDRAIVTEPRYLYRDYIVPDVNDTMPVGDYNGINWKNR